MTIEEKQILIDQTIKSIASALREVNDSQNEFVTHFPDHITFEFHDGSKMRTSNIIISSTRFDYILDVLKSYRDEIAILRHQADEIYDDVSRRIDKISKGE